MPNIMNRLDKLKSSLGEKATDAGKEFLFGLFFETNKKTLAESFGVWINKYSLDDFRDMIAHQKIPDIPPDYIIEVEPFAKYLEKFSIEDILEFIGEANIELLQLIMSYGESGMHYVVKLRKTLLEYIKRPASIPLSTEGKKPPDTVLVTCDKCGKRFPVKKEDASKLKKCPFCGE